MKVALYRTSPGPFGATLPKGEGMRTSFHSNNSVFTDLLSGSFSR